MTYQRKASGTACSSRVSCYNQSNCMIGALQPVGEVVVTFLSTQLAALAGIYIPSRGGPWTWMVIFAHTVFCGCRGYAGTQSPGRHGWGFELGARAVPGCSACLDIMTQKSWGASFMTIPRPICSTKQYLYCVEVLKMHVAEDPTRSKAK
jgi:hypothetical protein